MNNEQLAVSHSAQSSGQLAQSVFATATAFEHAYRVGKMLAASDLVPQHFRNRPENCVLALEMSNRLGASPLAVLQSLYVVHGRPAWSSQFLIAMVNASGRFMPLQFTTEGTADEYGCFAWAKLRDGSDTVTGPKVTIGMAKAEGWFGKTGSKWQTMPELMLRYRAATFFARLYAPDLTLGMATQEEAIDTPTEVLPAAAKPRLFVLDPKAGTMEPVPEPGEPPQSTRNDPESADRPETAEATSDEPTEEQKRIAAFKRVEDGLKPWGLSPLDIHQSLLDRKIMAPGRKPADIMRAPLRALERIEKDLEAIAAETKERGAQ